MNEHDYLTELPGKLLRYFERAYANNSIKEFAYGAECSREWAALATLDSPPADRVAALLSKVEHYDGSGTAWIELSMFVNEWARKNGFGVEE